MKIETIEDFDIVFDILWAAGHKNAYHIDYEEAKEMLLQDVISGIYFKGLVRSQFKSLDHYIKIFKNDYPSISNSTATHSSYFVFRHNHPELFI